METIELGTITAIRGDCMEYMRTLPDKCFNLAIVDPPYGIGEGGKDKRRRRKGETSKVSYSESRQWDNSIPDAEYFNELGRISENQIIFGANYMVRYLKPSMGWIVWDKGIAGDFSDCELAYTSFSRAFLRGNTKYAFFYSE